MTENRRQFSRVLFYSEAILCLPGVEIPVCVLDISIKGALICPVPAAYADVGTTCVLKLYLGGGDDALIRMEATVVHHQGVNFGLACREIDLDSMTHLRRLIELNLGDEAALNRELNALVSHA